MLRMCVLVFVHVFVRVLEMRKKNLAVFLSHFSCSAITGQNIKVQASCTLSSWVSSSAWSDYLLFHVAAFVLTILNRVLNTVLYGAYKHVWEFIFPPYNVFDPYSEKTFCIENSLLYVSYFSKKGRACETCVKGRVGWSPTLSFHSIITLKNLGHQFVHKEVRVLFSDLKSFITLSKLQTSKLPI